MATCKDNCLYTELCKYNDGISVWSTEHCPLYKDKDRYIELPCKVGDTVYVVPSETNFKLNVLNKHEERNRIYRQLVHSVEVWSTGYLIRTSFGLTSVHPEFYKIDWFLTEEEAEQKLKELSDNG